MTGNRSNGRAGIAGPAEAFRAQSTCYLKAAPLPDVWREQLDSLAAHAGHNSPGCAECLRLAQVVRILMRPFE